MARERERQRQRDRETGKETETAITEAEKTRQAKLIETERRNE